MVKLSPQRKISVPARRASRNTQYTSLQMGMCYFGSPPFLQLCVICVVAIWFFRVDLFRHLSVSLKWIIVPV